MGLERCVLWSNHFRNKKGTPPAVVPTEFPYHLVFPG